MASPSLRDQVLVTRNPALLSGGTWFESRLRDKLSQLRFIGVLSIIIKYDM